jgi:hypothetical protein
MEIVDLLPQYSEHFLGYGNPASDVYFIGKEEGGEYDEKGLKELLASWNGNGRKQTCDIKEDVDDETYEKYYGSRAKLQSTWKGLIRFLSVYENGDIPNNEMIREYQRHKFGCVSSNHALLEPFPLPNPSTNKWAYGFLEDPRFSCRGAFIQSFGKQRITIIKDLIRLNKPKVVVFYSTAKNYMGYWEKIIGDKVSMDDRGYYITEKDSTSYVVMDHPTRHGITNEYFENIAFSLRERLAGTI